MQTTIYFRGTDAEAKLSKQLSRGEADNPYGRGLRRWAPAFQDEFEQCSQVVLLPGVSKYDAERITAVYEFHGVPVLRFQGPVPTPEPEPTPVAAEVPPIVPTEAKALSNAQLRRLPTRQLRDLANGRGIDIGDAPDRAALIAALDGGKGPTP